jgi:integrase
MQAIRHLRVVSPTNEKRTVASPQRKANAEYRQREHLTEQEVEKLVEAAKDHRWGHRDSTMVLLAFRHGLRASELIDLRWEQIDLKGGLLHVRRVKQGTPATHPLTGRELRAFRRLQREAGGSPFVCCAMRAATSWQMMASIPARFRATSAISRSSTRCATPSYRQRDSKAYFEIERPLLALSGHSRCRI